MGVIAGASLRLEDASIALVGSGDRLVAEVDVYLEATRGSIPRAA